MEIHISIVFLQFSLIINTHTPFALILMTAYTWAVSDFTEGFPIPQQVLEQVLIISNWQLVCSGGPCNPSLEAWGLVLALCSVTCQKHIPDFHSLLFPMSIKAECMQTLWPSNSTCRNIHNRSVCMWAPRGMCKTVYSSIIWNSQKQPQIPLV